MASSKMCITVEDLDGYGFGHEVVYNIDSRKKLCVRCHFIDGEAVVTYEVSQLKPSPSVDYAYKLSTDSLVEAIINYNALN